ncbi:hypothetical protein ACH4OY_13735 [Micromonospora rubida]|uniref:Uncharacterized protein n=1 Tax=Micromonospora rubida TaxID=2697657 RepID=A0ABW7SP74_9ACTN
MSYRVVDLDADQRVDALLVDGSRVVERVGVPPSGVFRFHHPVSADPDAGVVVVETAPGLRVAVLNPGRADLALPATVSVTFTCPAPPPGTRLWVDPVRLHAVPDHVIPALRSHPDGTVALHLIDRLLLGTPEQLALHPGCYRVSGGVIALHPHQTSVSLAAVDLGGRRVPADQDGTVILDVSAATTVVLLFASDAHRNG